MFLALREIRSAVGRFSMITAVTMLITLLLVTLTGLTEGLGSRNTSGLEALGADRIAFVDPYSETPAVSFSNSVIDQQTLASLSSLADGAIVTPLGVGQTRAEGNDGAMGVGVFGLPKGTERAGVIISSQAVISEEIANTLGVGAGDTLTVGGQSITVGEVTSNEYYSHSPVIWVDTASWQDITHQDSVGTVALLDGSPAAGWDEVTNASHYAVVSTKDSFKGLDSYSSERSSLVSMQGFLYAISALVTISFLSVWNLQRTRDIAVLRCLGASRGYVFMDALVQSALILGAGSALGAALGAGMGALLVGSPVPFLLTPLTVLGPAVGVFVLGIIGALLAVRRVTKIDPLMALALSA